MKSSLLISTVLCQLLIGVNVVSCGLLRETGCPPPEDITPCTCKNIPFTELECKNIMNADDLRSVFENSVDYTYRGVHLEYSSIEYLPYDMFEHTPVIKLYLKNVTIIKLFDEPPQSLHMLENLFIENTRVLSGMTWNLLEPLTELRFLNIYYNYVSIIDEDFSQFVSKELEYLTLYQTETRKIKPGVLTQFPRLDKISIDQCKLSELTRDMFAIPFNGRALYFNDNKITTIPNDLFTQMPNLQNLGLMNNRIAMIPESAFESNAARITYVLFEGNPLKCDCSLQWLIRNKPSFLSGSCSAPKNLHGRELKDLSSDDFDC